MPSAIVINKVRPRIYALDVLMPCVVPNTRVVFIALFSSLISILVYNFSWSRTPGNITLWYKPPSRSLNFLLWELICLWNPKIVLVSVLFIESLEIVTWFITPNPGQYFYTLRNFPGYSSFNKQDSYFNVSFTCIYPHHKQTYNFFYIRPRTIR